MQNSSAQIKKCKLRCRPPCPVLCCLQRDTVTVVSYTDTKHERSQYCFKCRNGKMKRLQYWTIWNVFSAVSYLSESSLLFCSESAFVEIQYYGNVVKFILLEYCTECWVVTIEMKLNKIFGRGLEQSTVKIKLLASLTWGASGKTLVWDLLPDTVGQNW